MSASYASMLRWLIWREIVLAWRRRSSFVGTQLFFVLVVSLFPLAVGPDVAILRTLAAGVVWVAALLAAMLSTGRLFADDLTDGSLEQLLLVPMPLALVMAGRVFAHCLIAGLPLMLVAPLAGMQFGLAGEALFVLPLVLGIGTPVVFLLGGVGAALTVGLRGGASLTPLIVLPLCIPALLFGTAAVQAAVDGASAAPHTRLLAALLLLAMVFTPPATAAALRISLE